MKQLLTQPQPLDLTQSKIETTDPIVAAYYRAAFYEVKNRHENDQFIFTIDVDAIKEKYTEEEIESRQWTLMNFFQFYNSNMNLVDLAERNKEANYE